MRFWWVNHKQTWRQEIEGGYLWSPKREASGAKSRFYDNMRIASRGDLVVSYAHKQIRFCGIVTDDAVSAPKPAEFGTAGSHWADEGWRLPVNWTPWSPGVTPRSLLSELRPLLPDRYSPLTRTGDGAQKAYLSEISGEAFNLLALAAGVARTPFDPIPPPSFETLGAELSDAIEESILNDVGLSDTQKEQLTLARRGQGIFKRRVWDVESACRVTGISTPILLIASHIIPWRSCTTAAERLNGQNGLLLTPTIDRLFDRGLISFLDEGTLMISPRLAPNDAERTGVAAGVAARTFTDQQKLRLAYHRANVFLP